MPQPPLQKEKPIPIGTNDILKIDIKDLEFGYRTFPILKNLTASFNSPELVSIIGPNGVGKSTLIHCTL